MLVFRLPVLLVLFMLLLMYLLHYFGIVILFNLPEAFYISLGLFITGSIILAAGGYSFRTANTTVNPVKPENASSLVTTGIYRYSRNPQYIGFLLWVLAGTVYSKNLLNLVFLPIFVLIANWLYISREEKALEVLFGDAYQQYKKDVRRWL